jgi:hypothetical protein
MTPFPQEGTFSFAKWIASVYRMQGRGANFALQVSQAMMGLIA